MRGWMGGMRVKRERPNNIMFKLNRRVGWSRVEMDANQICL